MKIIVGLFIICICADFFFARAIVPDADMTQHYREMLAIFNGNILLNHWILAVDNYGFTDLVFFLIFGAIFGTNLWLLYVVPTFTFSLLLLAAILLVIRAAPDGTARWPAATAVLLLFGLPFAPGQYTFLVPAFHTNSIMLCLYAVLAIEPALSNKLFNKVRLVPFGLLIFAMTTSDPLTDILFVGPLLMLATLRGYCSPSLRTDYAFIAAVTLVSAVAGALWPSILSHNHGFHTVTGFIVSKISSPQDIEANIKAIFISLLILSDGFLAALPAFWSVHFFVYTRILLLVLIAMGCVRIPWRTAYFLDNGIAQLLLLGAASLIFADALSSDFLFFAGWTPVIPLRAIRFVTPAFVFLGLAGIIELQYLISKNWNSTKAAFVGTFLAFMAFFLILFAGQSVWQAARSPAGFTRLPQASLVTWLKSHHFQYGVGDYWTASMVTTLSNGSILADGILADRIHDPKPLAPNFMNIDLSCISAGIQPQFVAVTRDGYPYGISIKNVAITYQKPLKIVDVANYTVMILSIPTGLAPVCHPGRNLMGND